MLLKSAFLCIILKITIISREERQSTLPFVFDLLFRHKNVDLVANTFCLTTKQSGRIRQLTVRVVSLNIAIWKI